MAFEAERHETWYTVLPGARNSTITVSDALAKVGHDDTQVFADQADLTAACLFVALGLLLTAAFFTAGFGQRLDVGRIRLTSKLKIAAASSQDKRSALIATDSFAERGICMDLGPRLRSSRSPTLGIRNECHLDNVATNRNLPDLINVERRLPPPRPQ
jgi:hypothetical protein